MAELTGAELLDQALATLERTLELVAGLVADVDELRGRVGALEAASSALGRRVDEAIKLTLSTDRRLTSVHDKALRALTDRAGRSNEAGA